MTISDVRALVSGGEHETLELKKSTSSLKEGCEDLCGLLNTTGGNLCFGVENDGTVRGQNFSDDTLRKVADHLRLIEPYPTPLGFERVRVADHRDVLVLSVTRSESAPHTFDGRAFERIGTTTRRMRRDEFDRRLLRRPSDQHRWEVMPVPDLDWSAIDIDRVKRVVKRGIERGRIPLGADTPEDFFANTRLLDSSGTMNAAATLLFANDPAKWFPQAAVRMARFRGADKSSFVDQRQTTGHVFDLLDEADLFIRRHMQVAGRVEPGLFEREDSPMFPPVALREALVNAFCHRDYTIVGGAVELAIYDGRTEITSSGPLPFGLRIADLLGTHSSNPRNPILADVLYRTGYIEKFGRGIGIIIELCTRAGHPTPEFEDRRGEVVVRFRAAGYVPPLRIGHDLTERQRRILLALDELGPVSRGQILEAIGADVASDTVGDDLQVLRGLGLADGYGHGRGARWKIVHSNRETE